MIWLVFSKLRRVISIDRTCEGGRGRDWRDGWREGPRSGGSGRPGPGPGSRATVTTPMTMAMAMTNGANYYFHD